MIYLYEVGLGPAVMTAADLALPAIIGGTTLANWQAGGFNKPQRSGFIRTCPDRSTGSKPLADQTPDEVFQGRFHQGTLKRILKRISRVTISVSRLAYIEHEHRSHRFFQAIFFTHPSYGDDAKIARSVESSRLVDQTSRRAPALCPTGHTQSPGHFRPVRRREASNSSRMSHARFQLLIQPLVYDQVSTSFHYPISHPVHSVEESSW